MLESNHGKAHLFKGNAIIDTEQQRSRRRPVGSTKPEEQKRQRKDDRFSPMALAQIEQSRGERKETAFLEAAIAHYVAFLSGHYVAHEEVEHLGTYEN